MPKTPKTPDQLSLYQKEYDSWSKILTPYHTGRFSKNYRAYTAYTDTKGTKSRISDPMSPELIERVVMKLFERDPKFYSFSRGKKMPKEITTIIASTIEYFWTCPERVQSSGTMRSKLKVIGREFGIIGQAGTEVYYNLESETPDVRQLPIEDVVFNPTYTLKTSPVHYVRQFVSPQYIEDNLEREVDEDGRKIMVGRFKKAEAERILAKYRDPDTGEWTAEIKQDDSDNRINRSGSSAYEKPVGQILLISRYQGKKVCRVADWLEIIEESDDPMGIEEDPLDFAMDIEVPKEPYALSMLDFIAGLTSAKDMTLNQIIDYSSKALNPPLFVDPNIGPLEKKTLPNAFKVGGIVFANPQSAQHGVMPPLPQVGMEILGYSQQRAESVTGVGAYTGGVPNQTSDKTNGTKGGIEALIAQGVSPIRDRQVNLEESIIEPVVNKWLKMAGTLMGKNEWKFVMLSGESPDWVRVTKGLLTGKITVKDLLFAGLIDQEQAMSLALEMQMKGENPDEKEILEADWIVRVETGSMAESDTEKDLEAFDTTIKAGMELGLPIDREKVWKERALRSGVKDPEQYLMQQPQGMPGMAQPAAPAMPGMPPQAPQQPLMPQPAMAPSV